MTDVREGSKALAAFGVYRDMGPQRSIAKVAQECRKSVSLLYRWSTLHNWVQRAADHDAAIEAAVAATDREFRIEDSLRRRAERLAIADELHRVGRDALAAIEVEELAKRPADIVQMLTFADKTERLDLDEETDRTEELAPVANIVFYVPEK